VRKHKHQRHHPAPGVHPPVPPPAAKVHHDPLLTPMNQPQESYQPGQFSPAGEAGAPPDHATFTPSTRKGD